MAEDILMTDDELDLLLFTKEEEEFMVVPALEDSPIRLEDLLSEANFNVLTIDPDQNQSTVFVVDVERTSSNRSAVGNGAAFNSGTTDLVTSGTGNRDYQQIQHYPHRQLFSFGTSANNSTFDNAKNSATGLFVSTPQQQFNELADPSASWVTQATDVTILERLVSESDRFRSVDDILDIVPQAPRIQQSLDLHNVHGSRVLDQQQILDEIVREAEEISSKNGSPATTPEITVSGYSVESNDAWERITNSVSSFSDGESVDMDQPHQISGFAARNFDHTFGNGASKSKKAKTSKPKQTGDHQGEFPVAKSTKREGARAKKRDQNREAALRYRLKKRAQREATSGELSGLIERNAYLKNQKANIASEIAYLQGLLSEVQKKTGLKRLT